jgi:hypothetical protein
MATAVPLLPGGVLPAIVGIAVVLTLLVGPVLLGLRGWVRSRGEAADHPATPPRWTVTITSALLYALAFNLTFFIQELFLVLPKALTPGLRPTLFHNNHRWEGEHPLASLFQGTGVLAILITGGACALLLRKRPPRSPTVRLFLVWMTYQGFFQTLPQVVIGAISPRSDVGMAMDYLRLGATVRAGAAVVALAAIPPIALWLARSLLALAEDPAAIANGWARTGYIFRVATVPALIAIPLIIAFRVPRELIEVVMPPLVATVIGIAWVQAGAWRVVAARTGAGLAAMSPVYPLALLVTLLLVFQLVLRPGVPFF